MSNFYRGNGNDMEMTNVLRHCNPGETFETAYAGTNMGQVQVPNPQAYPQSYYTTVPQMAPQPSAYNPLTTLLLQQNEKISNLERFNTELVKSAAQAEKRALSAEARLQMMKTKIPNVGRCQFLRYNKGHDLGLMLVTREKGRVDEASVRVANFFVKKAVWVETKNDESYISAHFVDCTNQSRYVILHIPRNVYENNRKFLRLLGQYGITLEVDMNETKKALLLREYMEETADRKIYSEKNLGWTKEREKLVFVTHASLPWWDLRKRCEEKTSAPCYNSLKDFLCEQLSSEAMIFRVMLFSAKLLPLVRFSGFVQEVLINFVFNKDAPNTFGNVLKLLDVQDNLVLPLNDTDLKAILAEQAGTFVVFKVESGSLPMVKHNKLVENLQVLKNQLQVLPLICSEEPLWLRDFTFCTLTVEKQNFPELDLKDALASFDQYLCESAELVAELFGVGDVTEELGEFTGLYVLLQGTWRVLSRFIKVDQEKQERDRVNREIVQFLSDRRDENDYSCVGEQVAILLEKAVTKKVLDVISPYDEIKENAIIVADEEVYLRKETLQQVLEKTWANHNMRIIFRALLEEGFLVADVGAKTNYTTRRRCTNADGESEFPKFVVFKKQALVNLGDYDFLKF